MKRVIFCLFYVTIFLGPLICQTKVDSSAAKLYRHNFGITRDYRSGYGVSYKYWPGRVGIQFNLDPVIITQDRLIGSGITLLYKFTEAGWINLFLYQGFHFQYSKQNYFYQESQKIFYEAMGLGSELMLSKHLSLTITAGFIGFSEYERFLLTSQTGLFYRF